MMLKNNNAQPILRASGNMPQELAEALEKLEKITVGQSGWSASAFISEAAKDNGYVLYIMEENNVIALLTGYYAAGEGDITNVAVHPNFRRRGLAVRLVSEFERLLPNDAEEIFLEVRESNLPARKLYEKCGFEFLSLRKNFYSSPRENAVVMKKERKK